MQRTRRLFIFAGLITLFFLFVFSAQSNLNGPILFPTLNKKVMGNVNFFQNVSKNKNLILLNSAIFDPLRDGEIDLSGYVPDRLKFSTSGKVHILVQFNDYITLSKKISLKALGAKILEYIPNNALLVEVSSDKVKKIKNISGVRWVGEFQPGYRISPEIAEFLSEKKDVFETKVPEIVVSLFDGADMSEVLNSIYKNFSSDISFDYSVSERDRAITLKISYKNVRELIDFLANLEEVSFVEVYHRDYLKNDNSIWVCQSGDTQSHSTPVFNHGIMGQGQIVAVTDSGLDEDECAFINQAAGDRIQTQAVNPPDDLTLDTTQRKVVAYNVLEGAEEWDQSNHYYHGTHVCGSVAGDNYQTLATDTNPGHDTGDGMAPLAKLIMEDAGSSDTNYLHLPYPYGDLWEQEYNAGARIASNSWGSSHGSYYDLGCASIDLFTYQNEDFLICFASGNDGPLGSSLDYEGNAKNALVVGATKNGSTGAIDLASFSSKGPSVDGRIKPDVCAPGENIISAKGAEAMYNCGTWYMSGTSMACPTAAGLAALVRTYFEKGFYPSGQANDQDSLNPSAALVKAIMINSCANMTGTNTGGQMNTKEDAPSNGQGWGRITLDNALYFSGDSRKLLCWDYRNKDGLSTGMIREYPFTVNAKSGEPLKITLVWSDPPGSPHAAKTLVNDLDLELVAPDGTTYKGNQWNNQTSGDMKESAQNPTDTDTINNVEGILIKNPSSGTYTLRVKGTNVPGYKNDYKQGYALVVTGDVSIGNALTLNISNIEVTDNGNNDGNIDPGETIYLKISLSNNSTVDASSVSATLSSDSNKVSVTSNNVYYGDVSAGSTVTPTSSFVFDLASDAQQGSDLHFKLTITAGSQTFTREFSLRVQMPSVPPILTNLQIAEGNIYSVQGTQYPTYVSTLIGYHYNDPNLDIQNLYVYFKVNGEDIGTIPFVIPISQISPQTTAEGDDAWEVYAFSYFASNVGETVQAYAYLEDSLGNVSNIVESNTFTYTKGVTPSNLAGLDDDDSIHIDFPDGFTFPFYGKNYTGMWVNSDGNITFRAGYEYQLRSPGAFLNFEPRIAPLYTDLAKTKGNANQITMETGDDYVKVSWNGLPQWARMGPTGTHTFAVTLKKDGTIIFDYGECTMTESQEDENGDKWKGVVGLSPGGLTSGTEVDLSSYSGPIDIPVSGPIFEAFSDTDDFDLSNSQLVFKPITSFVPAQTVYFPVLSYKSGSKNVGFGLVNPNNDKALVKFTAYDQNGNEIAQSPIMSWDAKGQHAYEAPAIFQNIQDGTIGWVKAESSLSGLKGFFLNEDFSSGSLVGLDGASGFETGYTDLVIPEVKGLNNFTTSIYIVNLTSSDLDVTVKGYDAASQNPGSIGSETVTVPANGSYEIDDVGSFLGTSFDGYVELSASGNIIANAKIKDGTASISSLNGIPVSSAGTELYAPQAVYWQDTYYTQVFLVNTSNTDANVSVTLYNEDGTVQTSNPLTYTIPAGGEKILKDADLGLDTSSEKSLGWVKITSDQPIIGALEFGNPDDDHYRSTLPLQSTGMTEIYFSQVANGNVGGVDYWTGLALVNPGDSDATVNIEVYDSNGNKLGETGSVTVGPKVKLINMLRSLQNLSNLPDQASGYIHITSDKPVFAFELFGDGPLNFISAVPAQ